jgi:hypothetical protein
MNIDFGPIRHCVAARKVKQVIWSESSALISGEDEPSYFVEFDYGDHSETWILCFNKDGEEIARHNTNMIESIVWEVDES